MKILLTGAHGFVGAYLSRDILARGWELLATGSGENRLPFSSPLFQYEKMDLTDPGDIKTSVRKFQPEVIIHSGAMSKPDDCERNREKAYSTNVRGTELLLEEAARQGSFFVFVSTDFVFDGEKGNYREEDLPSPVNYYGETKLEAEKAVMKYPYDWAIARTLLVYGRPILPRPYLLSIVTEKLRAGEHYKVTGDQLRTPTYVEDLSSGILSIIARRAKGIFHLSGKDKLSPYQMALQAAQLLGLDSSLLEEVNASTYKEPARRPLKTGFNIEKAQQQLGYSPVSFSEGLKKTFGLS